MKKPFLRAALCLIILLGLSLTALGISGIVGKSAERAQQPYTSLIENRMNFTVDNTSFSFSLDNEEETFLLSFTLTAAKTEADFYAVLDSISFSGAQFSSVIYEPGDNNGDAFDPHALVMPVGKDGKPLTLSWLVTASFDCSAANTNSIAPTLQIKYTSGLKKDYSDSYMLSIPFEVNILNSYMLSSVLSDAQMYLSSDIYTQASLNKLQAAVNTATTLFEDKSTLTNEIISEQCTAISLAIQGLVKKGV